MHPLLLPLERGHERPHEPSGPTAARQPALRIGCIRDLNAQPLVARLDRVLPAAERVFDVPSALAEQLAHERLDAALIPLAEYLRHPSYHLIAGLAIGCRGPAWSVKLLSRCPWNRVRSIALDAASRTSAALAVRWIERQSGVAPQVESLRLADCPEQVATDAVLLIGDRALVQSPASFPHTIDLGVAWRQWSGCPMVFAVWAARKRHIAEQLAAPLGEAHRLARADLTAIATAAAAKLPIDRATCHAYLSRILCYQLGPAQRAGMLAYQRLVLHQWGAARFQGRIVSPPLAAASA